MQIFLACLFVTFSATVYAHHDYHHHHHHQNRKHSDDHHLEQYSHPKYEFGYGVHDPHTHDMKKQWESRDGDVVKGSYRLIQPDGRVRVVNYYADGKNGFNAEVKYQGKAHHPTGGHGHSLAKPSQGFSKGLSSAGGQSSHWRSTGGQTSFHYSPSNQRPVHAQATGESGLSAGYSVGLAGGLDPHVVGYDVQEPHE